MRHEELLHPDLADCARRLIARGRLLAEREPELYRAAVRGRAELAGFFASELGWSVDVLEPADMVRLHKRRVDVPSQRGPRLRRDGRESNNTAPRLVLILTALACEQLWRRPRMTLNDLLQAVAQVCAEDSEQGLLPRLPVVPGDGVSKREALANRQSLVDALRILEADGTITIEGDLDRAVADNASDGVVAASRDRLAAKFSSLSPSLLKLTQLPPNRHAAALTSDQLLEDEEPADEPGTRGETTMRRRRAIRRLVDDPGADPVLDEYLQTSTGRNRALNVLHALKLVGTVRHDWWQVSDPTGLGSTLDFPNGRRNERQAALALLDHLGNRALIDDRSERPLAISEIVELFEQVRVRLPRWASAYEGRLPALARAAAAELVDNGFLIDMTANGELDECCWRPTPAVRMWRIKLISRPPVAEPPATLFDPPEGAV
ncbi:TIGR02678 family protein [Amycolatopsis xylanica]|uniref:TIGR02678 family protein n=1 Tax=Amycolatopsis xylanica TaxID=589385 RepID=A0A1H2SG54_9PSEU|nr:DUF2398 family protein [Amycolatopsis xylanica]SDW30683.1 TIGR02678 family protein [Amycolatopsis xylanica]